MEELTKRQGIEKLPWVYNIFLSKDGNFIPESISFRQLRYRVIFKKIEYPESKLLVFSSYRRRKIKI